MPTEPISTYSQSVKRLIAMVHSIRTTRAKIVDVAIPAEGATAYIVPVPIGPVAITSDIAAIIPATAAGPQNFANFTAFMPILYEKMA
jgi:hypothetical protein